MGLPFDRTPEGRIAQRRFGGHTAQLRRGGRSCASCYAADRTGHMILQTLYQQCIKHGVTFFDEFHVHRPASWTATASAAASSPIDIADGELHVFHAKAVLLATGGFGRMFKVTSNAHALTGDGVGVAYRRGMPLEDMEFFQFHPTGIYGWASCSPRPPRRGRHPAQRRGRALHGALRAHAQGPGAARRGLALHLPGGPRGPRHRRQGLRLPRHPHRRPPPRAARSTASEKLPDIIEFARVYQGVDPITEPVPDPADRALRHGRHPDRQRRPGRARRATSTVMPGLYAAGECACVSVHGANRLGTN